MTATYFGDTDWQCSEEVGVWHLLVILSRFGFLLGSWSNAHEEPRCSYRKQAISESWETALLSVRMVPAAWQVGEAWYGSNLHDAASSMERKTTPSVLFTQEACRR